jgi:hypothetical protein
MLIDAFCEPEKLLYYKKGEEGGFRDGLPSAEGWETLDGKSEAPLVMTGRQLVDTGVALKKTASSRREVCEALGLPSPWCVTIINLKEFAKSSRDVRFGNAMRGWRRWYARMGDGVDTFFMSIRRDCNDILGVAAEVAERANRGQALSKEQQDRLNQRVDECEKLPKSDDKGLNELAELGGKEWADQWRKTCKEVRMHIDQAKEFVRPIGKERGETNATLAEHPVKVVEALNIAAARLDAFIHSPMFFPEPLRTILSGDLD